MHQVKFIYIQPNSIRTITLLQQVVHSTKETYILITVKHVIATNPWDKQIFCRMYLNISLMISNGNEMLALFLILKNQSKAADQAI